FQTQYSLMIGGPSQFSLSQMWNETIGVIFVVINGTGPSADQGCQIAMEQYFNEIKLQVATIWGINVQKLYNTTMTISGIIIGPAMEPIDITAGILVFTALNTSAEVYNALKGTIPDNTFAKTIANKASPSHLIQIGDMKDNTSGLITQLSVLSVGATIEGQIGSSVDGYTFSTRNLLGIPAGNNITSQAPAAINIVLPATSNITNYYPQLPYPNPYISAYVMMLPSVYYSLYPFSVEDVNVTYTLEDTVPYIVAEYDMTNWNMNPGETANLTLTLRNRGTATAYNIYFLILIQNSTVMFFTHGYPLPPISSYYHFQIPFLNPGDNVTMNLEVTANNSGSTYIQFLHQFQRHPTGLTNYSLTGVFSAHVGPGPLILCTTNCSNWIVSPGDTVSVYLTVKNVGTQTAYNVTSVFPNLGPVIDSNITGPEMGQLWMLGNISAGGAITVNVTSEVDYPIFHTGGTQVLSSISYPSSAFMPLTLPGLRPSTAALLEFEKYPRQVSVNVGDEVSVIIKVNNLGAETEYVSIVDLVPSEYFEVSAGSTNMTAYVNSGGSVTLTYTLKAKKAGTVKLPPPIIAQNYTFAYAARTIETTPPTVNINSPAEGAVLPTSSVEVTWAGSDNLGIDHYEVRIDGGSWINVGVSTSYVFSGLSNGSHTVEVRALDLAGNDATDSVSFIVSLPPAAPVDLSAIILLVLVQLMRQPGVPLVYVAIGGFALVVIVAVGVVLMLLRRR
ncbi:MAG: Ig-like domain-containing protein, partial [Candidatus Jordarchaeaceae archaeon]